MLFVIYRYNFRTISLSTIIVFLRKKTFNENIKANFQIIKYRRKIIQNY